MKQYPPNAAIEHAARSSSAGTYEAVQPLALAVMAAPHRFAVPAEAQTILLSRTTQAEISYWQGLHKGVDEKEIVGLINSLAERFGLPEYAKTTEKQVRVIRMEALLNNPVFLGRGMAHDQMRVGDQISSTLSPLQALHIIQTLIDQKFYNPVYQVSPAEWDRVVFPQEMSRVYAYTGSGQAAVRGQVHVNRRELEDRLSEHLSTMSTLEGLNLLQDTLDRLGIY